MSEDKAKPIPTPDFLHRVYEIAKTHPDRVTLETFEQYGLRDKELVRAALNELQKQGRVKEWPLFAPLPENK